MQDQAPTSPAYDLGHYLRPLQRHRRWLVIAVVGGLVLGLAYAAISKPTYSTGTRVLVYAPLASSQTTVTAAGSRTPNALVNMDTEAQNVKSLPVAVLAQQYLKTSTSPNTLLGRVSVTVPPNTTVLRIACKARSATAAQACANAFANAYLKNRASGETADINRQLTTVSPLLASFNTKLQRDLTAAVGAAKGTVAKNLGFGRVANDNAQIAELTGQQDTLNLQLHGLPGDAGKIQSLAGRGVASKVSRGVPPITGLILGLLIGIAAVFGRERFDRKVRHRDDLLSAGVELIAEIEVGHTGPASRTRFDQRIASIVAGSFDDDGGVVYVACVSPNQADADVAGRLASTLASVGHEVELVRPFAIHAVETADFESTEHSALDGDRTLDTSASLLGWPSAAEESTTTELMVPEPAEVVLTPVETAPGSVPMTIRIQLEMARRRAHFVVVDGDPAATDAQAYILAGLSDATLLVVDPEATTRRDLDEVVDQLSVTGTNLLGAVIWRPLRPKQRNSTADAREDRIKLRPQKRTKAIGAARPADRATMTAAGLNGSSSMRASRPVDAAR